MSVKSIVIRLAFLMLAVETAACSKSETESQESSPETQSPTAPATGGPNAANGATINITGTLAVGFDNQNVDSARAFPVANTGVGPNQVGQSVSAPIVSGTLAIGLPKDNGTALTQGQSGQSEDWVVVLMDLSKEEKIDQVVGFVGLDSGFDSLIKMPIGKANTSTINLGQVALDGEDATSSVKLSENASSFAVQLSSLNEIASTDNIIRGLKNSYANTSNDGATYYQAKPFFVYRGNATETLNKFSSPEHIKYAPTSNDVADFGYGFYFAVNDPTVATFENICASENDARYKQLKLVPPSDLLKNSVIYNATNPLSNKGLTKTSNGNTVTCSGGEFYMSGTPGSENYSFNFGGGGYKGAILPGLWRLYIQDSQVAAFDFTSYSPVGADGKPLVYVPVVKLVVNSENKIDKIEVKFQYWDKNISAFSELTDMSVFNKAVSNLTLTLNDSSGVNGGCSGSSISKQVALNNPSANTYIIQEFGDGKWRAPGDMSTAEKVVTSADISYDIGGVTVHYDFRPANGDGC